MRHRQRRRQEESELNITAFMNLMVILVPFLLMTAAFSQIAILELNLPQPDQAAAANQPKKKELQLEIIIRKDALEVSDREGGLIKRIENTDKGYDTKQLSDVLLQIKNRFPEKLDASILSESDTHYETVILIMDSVRQSEVMQTGTLTQVELFPVLSIGDAPPPAGSVINKGGKGSS